MLKKKKLPLREFQDRFWTEERCRNKSGREALAGGLCLSKVWAQTWLFAVKREISMHLLSTPEFCNCKNGYAPQPCLFDKVVSRHIRHGSG